MHLLHKLQWRDLGVFKTSHSGQTEPLSNSYRTSNISNCYYFSKKPGFNKETTIESPIEKIKRA